MMKLTHKFRILQDENSETFSIEAEVTHNDKDFDWWFYAEDGTLKSHSVGQRKLFSSKDDVYNELELIKRKVLRKFNWKTIHVSHA